MGITEEQQKEWDAWVAERPENVRVVAEKIVPWKKYKDIRSESDMGNRYVPVSYEISEEGNVTVTCHKINEDFPIFGGMNVFGISPENLVEEEE